MSRAALAAAIALVLSASAGAQDASGSAALARYLGTWTYEGTGNGGRVTCKSERRWIADNAFVESHRECETPNGSITQVELFGFNPRRGVYTYVGYNGRLPSTYVATAMGATVSWTGEDYSSTARCRETFAADLRSSTDQCEITSDGGKTWRVVAAGTAKRIQ